MKKGRPNWKIFLQWSSQLILPVSAPPGEQSYPYPSLIFGYAATVIRIGFVKVHQLSGFDPLQHPNHCSGDVAEELVFLAGVHQVE
jgi:hypothetical protein